MKRVPTFLSLLSLLVIAIIAVLLFPGPKSSRESVTGEPRSSVGDIATTSNEVAEQSPISWVRASFPPGYPHSVDVSYPADWSFICCGDKDTSSNHVFRPQEQPGTKQSYIVLTDYVLIGCPETAPTCGFEKIVPVTAAQKLEELQNAIAQNQSLADIGVQNLQLMGEVTLQGLGTYATVYRGMTTFDPKPVELYLTRTDSGVISVSIHDYESFDRDLIAEFLRRIEAYRY